jgi:Family of unknown function (DUF6152)
MKSTLMTLVALTCGLLLLCGSAAAHHGSQGYDFSRRITVKGIVSKFEWANPHAQIYLDAKGADGKIVNWGLELNNPGNLVRLGWTHLALKDGDEVTLVFNPGKDGKPVGICVDVFFQDGRKLHSDQGCGVAEAQQ